MAAAVGRVKAQTPAHGSIIANDSVAFCNDDYKSDRDRGRPHTIAASNSRAGAAQELLDNDIRNVGKGHLRTSPAK